MRKGIKVSGKYGSAWWRHFSTAALTSKDDDRLVHKFKQLLSGFKDYRGLIVGKSREKVSGFTFAQRVFNIERLASFNDSLQ